MFWTSPNNFHVFATVTAQNHIIIAIRRGRYVVIVFASDHVCAVGVCGSFVSFDQEPNESFSIIPNKFRWTKFCNIVTTSVYISSKNM